MHRCDICHKTAPYVNELLDCYKTDKIEDVCPDCDGIINVQLRKIKSVTTRMTINLFKSYITNLIKREAEKAHGIGGGE